MRKYKVDLGVDVLGNLTRIENEIVKFFARLEDAKTRKTETIVELRNKFCDMLMVAVYFSDCYDSVGYMKKVGIL